MRTSDAIATQRIITDTDEGTFTGNWARHLHAVIVVGLSPIDLIAYNGWRSKHDLPELKVREGRIFAAYVRNGRPTQYSRDPEAFGLTGKPTGPDPHTVDVAKLTCSQCGAAVTYESPLDGGEDVLQCRPCSVTLCHVAGTAAPWVYDEAGN